MQGYDSNFNGNGIPYRFAQYNVNGLDITVGNFYEQFGNGLIFRSYEEKTLGIDNVMDGIRLKYSPLKGLLLKGFVATQRLFWEQGPWMVELCLELFLKFCGAELIQQMKIIYVLGPCVLYS